MTINHNMTMLQLTSDCAFFIRKIPDTGHFFKSKTVLHLHL